MGTARVTKPVMLNETGVRIAEALEGMAAFKEQKGRVSALADTVVATGTVVTITGTPGYVDDVTQYSAYGITEPGFYAFCRIAAPDGMTVTADTTVTGADGYIATAGADHIDVALMYEVAALSKTVTISWGAYVEVIVFNATDLAIRNLDYRVTFYVYPVDRFAKWEFTPSTDATFGADKYYYQKDGTDYTLAEVTAGDPMPHYYEDKYTLTADTTFADGKTYYTVSGGVYTPATVTTGEAVTADTYYEHSYAMTADETFAAGKTYYTLADGIYTAATVTAGEEIPAYYVHSKVTFEGMTRNVTYTCETPIDCPTVFKLPEVEDDDHGCWFEIRFRHTGSFSSTLEVPEGVKVATEHTQAETKGVNMVNLLYTSVAGVKVWRFMNTHSSIPA